MKTTGLRAILLTLLFILTCLFVDPALANKFETIGSGVSGSIKIKVEYLRIIAYTVSGIFFILSILTVVTQKKNAHQLNYTVWMPSSIIFFLLSILSLVAALLL